MISKNISILRRLTLILTSGRYVLFILIVHSLLNLLGTEHDGCLQALS